MSARELTREQIEDLKNEICEDNGWMTAAIPQFHALCDMALASLGPVAMPPYPKGLSDHQILCTPADEPIFSKADYDALRAARGELSDARIREIADQFPFAYLTVEQAIWVRHAMESAIRLALGESKP